MFEARSSGLLSGVGEQLVVLVHGGRRNRLEDNRVFACDDHELVPGLET